MLIKVYCQNMNGLPLFYHKRERRHILLDMIAKENPDVIFLQEIVFRQEPLMLSQFLEPLGYNCFFKNKRLFNSGGLFIATKLKYNSPGFMRFKDQGSFFKTDLVQRMLTLGISYVKCKVGRREVVLATSHLNYRPPKQDSDRTTTNNQVKEVVSFFKNERNVIFGGDFNFTPESEIYLNLLKESGFKEVSGGRLNTLSMKNSYRQRHIKFGFIHEKEDCAVDFIFYKGSVRPIKSRVIGEEKFVYKNNEFYISDHFGIEARFEL